VLQVVDGDAILAPLSEAGAGHVLLSPWVRTPNGRFAGANAARELRQTTSLRS
jgi:hypothetical protein